MGIVVNKVEMRPINCKLIATQSYTLASYTVHVLMYITCVIKDFIVRLGCFDHAVCIVGMNSSTNMENTGNTKLNNGTR